MSGISGVCPHCGNTIELPDYTVGFNETCPICGGDLHVCIACKFYAPGYHNDCREPHSERIVDKNRMNRCDWFEWAGARTKEDSTDIEKARAALEALFKKDK